MRSSKAVLIFNCKRCVRSGIFSLQSLQLRCVQRTVSFSDTVVGRSLKMWLEFRWTLDQLEGNAYISATVQKCHWPVTKPVEWHVLLSFFFPLIATMLSVLWSHAAVIKTDLRFVNLVDFAPPLTDSVAWHCVNNEGFHCFALACSLRRRVHFALNAGEPNQIEGPATNVRQLMPATSDALTQQCSVKIIM